MGALLWPSPPPPKSLEARLVAEQARQGILVLGLVLTILPLSTLVGRGLVAAVSRGPTLVYPVEPRAALMTLPTILVVGLGLAAVSRLRRAGDLAPAVFAVGLGAAVAAIAVSETPYRLDGGPSVMPFVVLLGVVLLPYRPLTALALALMATTIFLLAILVLPLAKPVPDGLRWMVVQSNLAFVPIIASTALVVSAAVHRVRSSAIRAQVEREALLVHNEAQARDLAAANRELLEAQGELVRRRHVAVLANLVAGLSHELNNPSGALQAASDVIGRAVLVLEEELVQPPPRAAKALEALRRSRASASEASARVVRVVAALRRFARVDEAEEQLVDVHDCLESALALIEPDLGRVVVARDFEAGQRMLCRPALLNEVFLELLSNALEAQPSGGRIELTSRFSGDEARFVVRDEGGGIAPEHLERVFEPGFTTKGRGVGVGLGLSTVRRIVEEHGGRVEVASAVGRGTTFTVILPRRA